jgi:Cysteine-rich CPCC
LLPVDPEQKLFQAMSDSYPCPCCGHLVFCEPPGSYEICPICFWEDDVIQLVYPLMDGGANKFCLFKSQKEFARCGACEPRFTRDVRRADSDEPLDPTWRPFDPANDVYLRWDSPEDHHLWQSEPLNAVFYYWRDDDWLSSNTHNA